MKNKKYRNIMTYNEFKESNELGTLQKYEFVCRGNNIGRRKELLYSFLSSISSDINFSINNSYLFFETEPNNPHDSNAIAILCGGEIFGTIGYVGKDYTKDIKQILDNSKSYKIEFSEDDIGKDSIFMTLYSVE